MFSSGTGCGRIHGRATPFRWFPRQEFYAEAGTTGDEPLCGSGRSRECSLRPDGPRRAGIRNLPRATDRSIGPSVHRSFGLPRLGALGRDSACSFACVPGAWISTSPSRALSLSLGTIRAHGSGCRPPLTNRRAVRIGPGNSFLFSTVLCVLLVALIGSPCWAAPSSNRADRSSRCVPVFASLPAWNRGVSPSEDTDCPKNYDEYSRKEKKRKCVQQPQQSALFLFCIESFQQNNPATTTILE